MKEKENEKDLGVISSLTSTIEDLATALSAPYDTDPTFIVPIKDAMNILHKQLQSTSHLVDLLKPEDLGLLVAAERAIIGQEIFDATKPKPKKERKKAISTTVSKKDLASLMAGDMDDF